MDTIKILLAITAALLGGALTWNYLEQKKDSSQAPKDEIALLQQQINAIELEEKNLINEKRLRNLGVDVLAESRDKKEDEAKAKLLEEAEANAARARELEAELAKQKEEDLKRDEEGLIDQIDLEKKDKELRRARLIAQALVMGKVTQYVNDPNSGNYVAFDIKMPDQVQVDTVLAVRRKDGIAGNVRVTLLEAGEGIADVLPGVGPFTPEPGDELISPPF